MAVHTVVVTINDNVTTGGVEFPDANEMQEILEREMLRRLLLEEERQRSRINASVREGLSDQGLMDYEGYLDDFKAVAQAYTEVRNITVTIT